jgi:hypothetical protein
MKDTLWHMTWLGWMALEGAMYFWYITAPICALFVAALVWLLRINATLTQAVRTLLFLIPLSWLVILAVGVIFVADPRVTRPEDTTLPGITLITIACGTLLSYLFCIGLAGSQRIAATGLALIGIWFGLFFYLVAAMSVSGVWL